MTIMRRGALIAAVGLAGLSGCSGTDMAAYEADERPLCFVRGSDWPGNARTLAYVETAYSDLEEQMNALLFALARANERGASGADEWAPLHQQAQAAIRRLGRLLPRVERQLDLAPMADQFGRRDIGAPRGDHYTEYLRVALAREFADHQNLGDHMAGFLASLDRVETLLLGLKAGTADAKGLPAASRALGQGWDAVRPGMMRVIFDRPDMPTGDALSDRLLTRVSALCEEKAECGEADGCGGSAGAGPVTAATDGAGDEPMEAR